jgi:hypothetical protein
MHLFKRYNDISYLRKDTETGEIEIVPNADVPPGMIPATATRLVQLSQTATSQRAKSELARELWRATEGKILATPIRL